MNNRTNYLYQFHGRVLTKRLAQSPPQSKYAGQSYYVITIKQLDQTKKSIQVFKDKLASSKIWTSIQEGTYSGQYDFYCRNQKGYYYLVDWEKTEPLNQKAKSKSNHHDLN